MGGGSDALPKEIGELKALKELNLLGCTGLKELPKEISSLQTFLTTYQWIIWDFSFRPRVYAWNCPSLP